MYTEIKEENFFVTYAAPFDIEDMNDLDKPRLRVKRGDRGEVIGETVSKIGELILKVRDLGSGYEFGLHRNNTVEYYRVC